MITDTVGKRLQARSPATFAAKTTKELNSISGFLCVSVPFSVDQRSGSVLIVFAAARGTTGGNL